MKLLVPALVVLVSLLPVGAGNEAEDNAPAVDLLDRQEIIDYWLDGKAEVTRYDLQQALRGELRRGDAVLVFETRDFLPDEGVETDSPDRQKMGALPVLKLNFTKEFETGVNPYSIMTWAYTPLQSAAHPRALASGTAIQDWSGPTWVQLDLRDDTYKATGRSQIDAEANHAVELEAIWLEDEIWARIRLAPSTLPTGMVPMIPGGEQSLLRRRPLAAENAKVSLAEQTDGVMVYAIRYAKSNRKLAIRFEKDFPHAILGWDEWYQDALGTSGRDETTKATQAESIRLDYRNRNGNEDGAWRKKLGLD
jgi:hypothetical protein